MAKEERESMNWQPHQRQIRSHFHPNLEITNGDSPPFSITQNLTSVPASTRPRNSHHMSRQLTDLLQRVRNTGIRIFHPEAPLETLSGVVDGGGFLVDLIGVVGCIAIYYG